jgi:hypothetical protein
MEPQSDVRAIERAWEVLLIGLKGPPFGAIEEGSMLAGRNAGCDSAELI